jgi:hypothetical protein
MRTNAKKLYYQNGKSNRKLQAKPFVFPPRIAATATLIAVVLLGYVWLNNTTEAVGRKIKDVEKERLALVADIQTHTARWNELTSPPGLKKAMKDFGLSMDHAHGEQSVTVRNREVWLDRRPSSAEAGEAMAARDGESVR